MKKTYIAPSVELTLMDSTDLMQGSITEVQMLEFSNDPIEISNEETEVADTRISAHSVWDD